MAETAINASEMIMKEAMGRVMADEREEEERVRFEADARRWYDVPRPRVW